MNKKTLIAEVTRLGGEVEIDPWETGIGIIRVEAPHRHYWAAEGVHEICWNYDKFVGIPLTTAWRDLWPSIKAGVARCEVQNCEWCEGEN